MARPRKCWSATVGARGHSVNVYERTPGGPLWLRWWVPASPTSRGHQEARPLKHNDRDAALRAAREVAGQLLASVVTGTAGATVAEVFAAYEADVARYSRGDGPKEARRRMALWTAFLGATRNVATIDHPTIDRYVRERLAGRLKVGRYKLRPNPSPSGIAPDVVLLIAALNHACKVARPNGSRLLDANPIRGYAIPRTSTPLRPVATYDRFELLRKHADAVDPQRLFRGFMDLVEGLGWRVSAVCQLRARDIDRKAHPSAPHGRIFKNPDQDKEGAGGWLPMSKGVRAAVDAVLTANTAIGDHPLFPSPKARATLPGGPVLKPWSRYHARALLERAEAAAGLEKLAGGDFHPYRRKWATERKHLPPQDVAAAGSWRDLRALQTAYQQTDEATMLAVVSDPTKLREVKAGKRSTGSDRG